DAYIFPDKARTHEAYAQYNDLNGNFIIDNQDFGGPLSSNYVYVNFTLVHPLLSGDIYVAGAFNYWQMNENNLMTYHAEKGEYHYLVQSKQVPPYYLEGSHFETENDYEIFVYYRPFKPRADLLIGYMRFTQNTR